MKTQEIIFNKKLKKRKLLNFGIFSMVLISIAVLNACNKEDEDEEIPTASINYSIESNWVSFPNLINKSVDVFYVYPTVFGGTDALIMDITDDSLRMSVRNEFAKQIPVYENECNIYAPYYRQISFDVLSMSEEDQDKYLSIGYGDIARAFDYYIENLNNGRPFILAGHSQGSEQIINLIKEKFEDPELMNKLVAAYVIGYSVTDEDLEQCKWMKIAESADDFGVIITYNSQSETATGSPVLLTNANCINPLNWQTTSEYASKELNLGAVFFDDDGKIDTTIYQYTDAWIDDKGALVTNPPDVYELNIGNFPVGVYHKYDYCFFFNNLKENVSVRINSFQDQN